MGKMIFLFTFCLIALFSLPNDQYSQENVAGITTLVASSYLTEPYDYFAYHPIKLFDNNSQTSWFENREGPGLGESIYIEFQNPITVDEIRVMAGCFLKEYYIRNYRVKTLEVSLDGKIAIQQLKDFMIEQSIVLGSAQTVQTIRMTIQDVYKTTEYEDTAISEISFYGKGNKLKTDVSKLTGIIAAQPKIWQDMKLTPQQVGEKWGFTDPTGSGKLVLLLSAITPSISWPLPLGVSARAVATAKTDATPITSAAPMPSNSGRRRELRAGTCPPFAPSSRNSARSDSSSTPSGRFRFPVPHMSTLSLTGRQFQYSCARSPTWRTMLSTFVVSTPNVCPGRGEWQT